MSRIDPAAAHAVSHFLDNINAEFAHTIRVPVDKADAKLGAVHVDLTEYIGDVRNEVLTDFTGSYMHYVNKHGVAVRRLVLTGPEEVDGTVLFEERANATVAAVAA